MFHYSSLKLPYSHFSAWEKYVASPWPGGCHGMWLDLRNMLLGKTSCPGRQRDTHLPVFHDINSESGEEKKTRGVLGEQENSRAGSSTLHADQGKIEWQEGDSAPPGRLFQARPGSGWHSRPILLVSWFLEATSDIGRDYTYSLSSCVGKDTLDWIVVTL